MPKLEHRLPHPQRAFDPVRRRRTTMVLDDDTAARLDRYAREHGIGRGEAISMLLGDVDSLRIRLRAEMALRHDDVLLRMPERERSKYEKEHGRPDFKDLV